MMDPDESLETTRKRLLFRSWHRGTREMDLLLGRFAERNLVAFSHRQLQLYGTLLEHGDNDLYDWMAGREQCPPALESDVMKLLIDFKFTT